MHSHLMKQEHLTIWKMALNVWPKDSEIFLESFDVELLSFSNRTFYYEFETSKCLKNLNVNRIRNFILKSGSIRSVQKFLTFEYILPSTYWENFMALASSM